MEGKCQAATALSRTLYSSATLEKADILMPGNLSHRYSSKTCYWIYVSGVVVSSKVLVIYL
jgi:hypothetical protein